MKLQATLAVSLALSVIAASAWATSSSNEAALQLTADAKQRFEAAVLAEGYVVQKIETEHGEVEVKATRDGKIWELEVDPESGAILEAELED